MEDINNMNIPSFIKHIKSLSNEELVKMISSNLFFNLKEDKFKSFFLISDINIKKIILNNELLFDKIMNLETTATGRDILDLVDSNTLRLIIDSSNCNKYFMKISNYLANTKIDKFNELTENIDFVKVFPSNSYLNDLDKLKEIMIAKNIDNDLIDLLLFKIKNRQLSSINVLRINNNADLLILLKFNTLLNISFKDNNIVFSNGDKIDYNLIKTLNNKHLMALFNTFKAKGLDNNDNCIIATIKLYCLFGYDNALKIINDKFTYLTPSSVKRIANINFKDNRRAFRLKHQNSFYYHGLEDKIYKLLMDVNLNRDMLLPLTFNNLHSEISDLLSTIKIEINNNSYLDPRHVIKGVIINQINAREKYKKEQYLKTLETTLLNKKRTMLSASEIVYLFKELQLINVFLDSKKQVIPTEELQTFLLGNFKYDNDALLRLVLNNQALGLNNTISQVINHFEDIQKIITNSNGNLSINSILDIIDISKIDLYKMRPDEYDITLETFAKIVNSKNYCNETEDVIIKKACKLHRERKKKVYSSIPTVYGKTNGLMYEVAPFDAEYLLCCGIDTGSCLKIGGKGEALLDYCLTSPHAVIIYLTDTDGSQYICPVIRSGNGIHCNGIDPVVPDNRKNAVIKALQTCFKEICQKSDIEVATLTDLHMKEYMDTKDYSEYDLEIYIPLDKKNVYSDYNKQDIQNYILYNKEDYQQNNYYLSDKKYYQERNPIFKYNIVNEYDQERISLLINSIAYGQIDFLDLLPETKKQLKKDFKPLDIKDFMYIMGNKDWFIGVKKYQNSVLEKRLIPYDKRAFLEFKQGEKEINAIFGQREELPNKPTKR